MRSLHFYYIKSYYVKVVASDKLCFVYVILCQELSVITLGQRDCNSTSTELNCCKSHTDISCRSECMDLSISCTHKKWLRKFDAKCELTELWFDLCFLKSHFYYFLFYLYQQQYLIYFVSCPNWQLTNVQYMNEQHLSFFFLPNRTNKQTKKRANKQNKEQKCQNSTQKTHKKWCTITAL